MKFIKNKKGSHIGIILSFTLFVTSIIFLYNIIESPVKIAGEKSDNLDLIKNNFMQLTNEEVTIARIEPTAGCVAFDTPETQITSPQIYAVNNQTTDSSISAGQSTVSTDGLFTKVYYSNYSFDDNLNSPGTGCTPITPSSISNTKYATEKKITEFVNLSINNESRFQTMMEITDDYEFSFVFEFSDGTILGEDRTMNRNINSDIYSREYLVNYLSINAEERTGKLRIKVW